MWEIDSDGYAQNSDGSEMLCVATTFTVKLWRIQNHSFQSITIKTFDNEAEAREYIRAYVAAQNWENTNHAD